MGILRFFYLLSNIKHRHHRRVHYAEMTLPFLRLSVTKKITLNSFFLAEDTSLVFGDDGGLETCRGQTVFFGNESTDSGRMIHAD